MASSFNKVIIMGNLTRDPELRQAGNTQVASFAIAVNRKYKQGNELKDEVSYIDIVVFGKQAEACAKYIHKGDSVLVDGHLRQQRWEDTATQQKRSRVEVVCESINFMPKKAGTHSGGSETPPQPEEAPGVSDEAAAGEMKF